MPDFLDELDEIFERDGNSQSEIEERLTSLETLLPGYSIAICSLMTPRPQWHGKLVLPDNIMSGLPYDEMDETLIIPLGDDKQCFVVRLQNSHQIVAVAKESDCGPSSCIETEKLLVTNSVKLATSMAENLENISRATQYRHEKEAMARKHAALVEANHEQYLQLRRQEQRYAKDLEREIARQTEELRHKNEELLKASELKSEFLANMSHELRTPMNAILGFTEMLLDSGLSTEQREYASNIQSSATNLLALMNDILDLSKIEAGKLDIILAPFDICSVTQDIKTMFQPICKKRNNSFEIIIGQDVPCNLLGDCARIRQILVNLVGNAIKFTQDGKITIEVRKTSHENNQVALELSVSDTGIGITEDRQKVIFDKFTQADGTTTRKYGGTGLGLAICTQLAGLMGGTLTVESEPGRGSTFMLNLTLETYNQSDNDKAAIDTKNKPESIPSPQKSRQKTATILIVEDNIVNQKLFSIMLSKMGYASEIADNGRIALEMIAEKQYDLLLMDIQMPEMDGYTATRQIRKMEKIIRRKEHATLDGRTDILPVIGLTAHARKEDEIRCYDAGMTGYLSKPVSRQALETMIKKNLTG
jgi:signal transduction histidine kinase/ActR/RegA family two-component response regulator